MLVKLSRRCREGRDKTESGHFKSWPEQMGKILADDEKKEICEEKMVDKLRVHFRPVWISARASGVRLVGWGGQMGFPSRQL